MRAIDEASEPRLLPDDLEKVLPNIFSSAHEKVLRQFERFTQERG
jgi:hypothetical protein